MEKGNDMNRILAILALCMAPIGALATPLTLSYDVTDLGGQYQYDFELTVTNADGTYSAGQNFNWIIVGDAPTGTASVFPETGPDFFTSVPSIFEPRTTSGGHNGPTLLETANGFIGWTPTGLGDMLTFTGVSSVLVAPGDLLWSNISGSGTNADFETAEFGAFFPVAAVPLPATLPLLLVALGGGVIGLRKRKA